MTRRKSIPGSEVARRITGISTPFVGVQWEYSVPERDHVRALITFLEDRRVLYVPYHMEIVEQVLPSVQAMRQQLTETLQKLSETSKAVAPIKAMRAACRKFLTEPYPDYGGFAPWHRPDWRDRHDPSPGFFVALGELRATFGAHLAILAVGYGIELEAELAAILPPEPE